MKKVAILIMMGDVEPSLRNVEAFKDTVIKYCELNKDNLNHEYKFFTYKYGDSVVCYPDDNFSILTNLEFIGKESVFDTFEKTRWALSYVKSSYNPDVYIRVNISTHINIPLLDVIVDELDMNFVYSNRICNFTNVKSDYFGYVYPRGDFMMFGKKHCDDIIIYGKKYEYSEYNNGVEHIDDCLIGMCLLDGNPEYYKYMKMLRYNFVPGEHVEPEKCYINAIASRLKTTPPGKCSGYSWDDNNYRLYDVGKFYEIQSLVETVKHDRGDIDDVFVETKYQVMFFNHSEVNFEQYCNYINEIKAGQ